MKKHRFKEGDLVRYEGMAFVGDGIAEYSVELQVLGYTEGDLVLLSTKNGDERELKESVLIKG